MYITLRLRATIVSLGAGMCDLDKPGSQVINFVLTPWIFRGDPLHEFVGTHITWGAT